ncbi:hypothetical protein ACFLY6_03200, partial [Candidatus Dependentiae bacterium]
MQKKQIFFVCLATTLVTPSNFSRQRDFSSPAFNAPALQEKTKQKKVIPIEVARRMPVWPTFGRFPENEDLTTGELSFEWASWCFTSTGDVQDASGLVVGEDGCSIGDLVLLAKLFEGGKIESGAGSSAAAGGGEWRTVGGSSGQVRKTRSDIESDASRTLTFPPTGTAVTTHYLSKISPKKLSFDAISKELSLNLSYSRSFYQQLCCVTFEIPIKLLVTKIDMTRVFGPEENDVMRNAQGDDFFDLYPAGLPDFYEDMLYRKNMIKDPQNVRLGLGD